jgi:hypothetical protein
MEIILILGLVALIALNVYASYQCFRDNFSTRGQRLSQIVFVWVVPVVGAVLALRLSRVEPERSSGTYQAEKNVGDEYVGDLGRQNSRGYLSPLGGGSHATGGDDVSPD